MRKLFFAALLAGAAAVPAQAGVGLVLVGNLTYSELFFDPSIPPWEQEPIVSGPYLTAIEISSSSWDDMFSTSGVGPYFFGCGPASGQYSDPCLVPSRHENTLSFTAPILGDAYQSLAINLIFNQNIELDPSAILSKNFVSGSYSWGYGHREGSASIDGPIHYIYGVPEPATWAMMIGGFALAGAAMRRRKVAVNFA